MFKVLDVCVKMFNNACNGHLLCWHQLRHYCCPIRKALTDVVGRWFVIISLLFDLLLSRWKFTAKTIINGLAWWITTIASIIIMWKVDLRWVLFLNIKIIVEKSRNSSSPSFTISWSVATWISSFHPLEAGSSFHYLSTDFWYLIDYTKLSFVGRGCKKSFIKCFLPVGMWRGKHENKFVANKGQVVDKESNTCLQTNVWMPSFNI